MASLRQKIVAAMWRQDDEALYRLAKCQCCCHEHTSDWCEARIWYGCRGQWGEFEYYDGPWAVSKSTVHGDIIVFALNKASIADIRR